MPLIERARDVIAHGGTITLRPADPQHRARGRHDARPPRDARPRRERPAVRIDRREPHRLGRAVLRRLHARRHHAASRGRLERLRRQGPLGRTDRDPAAARGDLRRVAERHRRQRHRLRRDAGHDVPARRGGGAVLRAQLRRDRRRRGRRRPRAGVHDRRARRHPRRDRPQPRCRHVRRYGVHLPARPRSGQPRGAGGRRARTRRARIGRCRDPARPARAARRRDRLDARGIPARRLRGGARQTSSA